MKNIALFPYFISVFFMMCASYYLSFTWKINAIVWFLLASIMYRAQNEAYKSGRPSTGVNGLLFSWLHCSTANGDAKRNV